MTIHLTIQAKVKNDLVADLNAFLEENLPNVRGFAGALNVTVFFNDQTNDFVIFEEWRSQDHHQAYIQFITEKGVLAALAAFFEEAPVITYYDRLSV